MTIKEIAKLAGVSSAAVSRYLNGGYVSDEKKEQIKKSDRRDGISAVGAGAYASDKESLPDRSGRAKD